MVLTERREDAIETGREELVRSLRRAGLPIQKLQSSPALLAVATSMGYGDLDSLHAALGEGHVSGQALVQRLERELRAGDGEEQLPSTALQPRRPSHRRGSGGIYVEGLDDVMVRLSRCCTPVPGDRVIGSSPAAVASRFTARTARTPSPSRPTTRSA